MKDKKISIVISVYNAERYLDKCLESIKEQSYNNWQAIIVNDGSTDNSNKIIEKWCNIDDRFVNINQKNMGPGAARNKGIKYALESNYNGYLTFIDADDYFKENGLEALLSPFINKKVDVTWAEFEVVKLDNEGQYKHFCDGDVIFKNEIMSGKQILELEKKEEYIERKWKIYSGLLWAKMYKVSDWNGIRLPEDMLVSEDIATTYKVLYKAKKVAMITNQVLCYQMTPNSLSKQKSERIIKYCEDQIKSQQIRIDFYKENNERELMYVSYVGLAEECLNNILYAKENVEYQKRMIKQYNELFFKLIKAPISFKRKMRYILYRFFMNKLFISRH